jgi:hypothetical protein
LSDFNLRFGFACNSSIQLISCTNVEHLSIWQNFL